mmetsp:Transcript_72385/g.141848  ORF Transcript_72385/g.141848 Transcript_72385/m.141848 type:complete len:255 (-) Transcript_72385:349-1113(-)
MFTLFWNWFSVRLRRLTNPTHRVCLSDHVDVERPTACHPFDHVDVGVIKSAMHHVEGNIADARTSGVVAIVACLFCAPLFGSDSAMDWVWLVDVVALVGPYRISLDSTSEISRSRPVRSSDAQPKQPPLFNHQHLFFGWRDHVALLLGKMKFKPVLLQVAHRKQFVWCSRYLMYSWNSDGDAIPPDVIDVAHDGAASGTPGLAVVEPCDRDGGLVVEIHEHFLSFQCGYGHARASVHYSKNIFVQKNAVGGPRG